MEGMRGAVERGGGGAEQQKAALAARPDVNQFIRLSRSVRGVPSAGSALPKTPPIELPICRFPSPTKRFAPRVMKISDLCYCLPSLNHS